MRLQRACGPGAGPGARPPGGSAGGPAGVQHVHRQVGVALAGDVDSRPSVVACAPDRQSGSTAPGASARGTACHAHTAWPWARAMAVRCSHTRACKGGDHGAARASGRTSSSCDLSGCDSCSNNLRRLQRSAATQPSPALHQDLPALRRQGAATRRLKSWHARPEVVALLTRAGAVAKRQGPRRRAARAMRAWQGRMQATWLKQNRADAVPGRIVSCAKPARAKESEQCVQDDECDGGWWARSRR